MHGDFRRGGTIVNFESTVEDAWTPSSSPSVSEMNRLRVLVATHSHPKLTRGGAEISADALVSGLRRHCGAEAWLLGCSRKSQTNRLAVPLTQPFGVDDFVYQAQDSFDHFKFANRDAKFPGMLRDLLQELRPDLIHFHHYANFGVEAFAIVKRTLPNAKIVLTLHEFLAICNHHGQMIKTKSSQLCEQDGLIACSACFPDHSPRDFFLRKSYIFKFFAFVDQFIAPSRFLAERYIRWGVDEGRMTVLDNVPIEPSPALAASLVTTGHSRRPRKPGWDREIRRRAKPVRIGFFGQMSPLKGILVLLAAARGLAEAEIHDIVIDIHGDYSNQPMEFQAAVETGLKEAGNNVRYHGPYDNAHVHRLMRTVDAVLVASTWWENSPVVIEEALANGKPVFCSNIGGMAEKVRPGVDGLWFEMGDSRSLMDLLIEVADQPDMLADLAATTRTPITVQAAIGQHRAVYDALLMRAGAPA